MADWTPIAVFPNIAIKKPIEANIAAFASHEDSRIKNICQKHPKLAEFLDRFSDTFGEKVIPTTLIMRTDAPKAFYTASAVSSLRDLVSICVIPNARATKIIYRSSDAVLYSDHFSIYPWMLDKKNADLIGSTPALLHTHVVEKFNGQSSPEIPGKILTESAIDAPLLQTLVKRWMQRYSKKKSIEDVALFRSLNMAYQACQVPGGTETTYLDSGRLIALWVSAFEILIHHYNNKSNLSFVCSHMEKTKWIDKNLQKKRYKIDKLNNGKKSLPCWLYAKIYRARCNFLHGEPVGPSDLIVKKTNLNLNWYAPLLYRMAIANFLNLTPPPLTAKISEPNELAQQMANRSDFLDFQKNIERVIIKVR